jgi:hypothetical protein
MFKLYPCPGNGRRLCTCLFVPVLLFAYLPAVLHVPMDGNQCQLPMGGAVLCHHGNYACNMPLNLLLEFRSQCYALPT